MRFLVDECCDMALVDALRDDGHDILYATELLRFEVVDRASKIPRLRHLLEQGSERLPGAFVVLEQGKVRIHPLL
jgi:hypothetical protein